MIEEKIEEMIADKELLAKEIEEKVVYRIEGHRIFSIYDTYQTREILEEIISIFAREDISIEHAYAILEKIKYALLRRNTIEQRPKQIKRDRK